MHSKLLEIFRRAILGALIVLMAATIAFATFELAWLLVVDLATPPMFLLEIDELLDIIRRDRRWNDEAARKQVVKLFEALGPTDPLTISARRRLSSLLFS